jgi:redox-sensitive bicupin YhaK (pirin superfamily)
VQPPFTWKPGRIKLALPEQHNAFIYFLNGEGRLADYGKISGHHAYRLDADGESIAIHAETPLRALLLTGMPLNERDSCHGPFVMNSETQILEAMRDYQMGKMGVLIEDDM